MELFPHQIEVKRTVPREDMEVKGVSKTTKIFVGGIPPSLTDGKRSPTHHFDVHKIRSITGSVGNFSLTDVRMLQES